MTHTILALLYAATGGLLSLISVPMIQGKVARNGIYGFRTPKTLSADRYWYPANRYMGRDMFVAGLAIAFGSIVMLAATPLFGLAVTDLAIGGLAIITVSMVVMMYRGFKFLRRL